MSYHHLNRVKAHTEAKLSHAERLLLWHFSYETRSNRSYYSESHRRLSETLQMDIRTVRRGLARLVDLGLLERIDKTGTHAPLYRLLVPCPPNCLDISDHNTTAELEALKTLVGTNTPTLNDIFTPPYIEKREEEDIRKIYFEGEAELGLLVAVLERYKTRDQQQEDLWQLVQTKPKAMAKAVLAVLAQASTPLNSPVRKLNYLVKVVNATPQNLLRYFIEEEAAERGHQLINASKEDLATKTANGDHTPRSTPERVKSYANKVLAGFIPKKTYYYLNQIGQGITAKNIYAAATIEDLLEDFTKFAGEEFWSKGWLTRNDKGLPKLEHTWGFMLSDEVAETLLTADQRHAYKIRTEGLELLRQTWNEAHPQDKGSIKFYSSEEALTFMEAHPLPEDFGNGQKLLDNFNAQLAETIQAYLNATPEAADPQGTYRDYLKENFTIEDDFNDLLNRLPERPEGHSKYFKKAFKSYQNALKVIDHSTLELNAIKEFGWDRREPSQYWKAPNTWIDEQVESTKQVSHY